MKLTRYENAAEFNNAVLPYLVQKEAENNLMLGLLQNILAGEYADYPPYMAVIESEGEIIMAVLRTPPHNVIVAGQINAGAIELLAQDLKREYGQLPGALGPKPLVMAFVQHWHADTGQTYTLDTAERIYQLEEVKPVPGLESGRLRRITPHDRQLVIEWIAAFNEQLWGLTDTGRAAELTDRALNADPALRGMYLWLDSTQDGLPVSLAAYSGPTPNGLRIGPVYTPPEFRRKGYATACVAALSQYLLDEGRKYCFLFTDLANPTSNHIYQDIGYEPICDVDLYRFV